MVDKHKMLVVNCVKFSADPFEAIAIEEVPSSSTPSEESVIVEVLVCFVDFVQTLLVQNKYQMKLPLPFTLGQEFTGKVIAVGSQVKTLKTGDLVLGGGFGCMAERIEMAEELLQKLPPSADPARVPSSYSYITAIHSLKDRAGLKEGETLLVLGASGGVGCAAIEIGKLLGAKVIAAASTEEKLRTCSSVGADLTINYSTENLKVRVRELTEGKGVNVVFDPVGDKYCEPAVRALAWRGRYVVVGFAAGEIPKIPANLFLLKEATLIGSAMREHQINDPTGFRKDREVLAKLFREGKLNPLVTQLYPFKDAPLAFKAFNDRRVQGKIALVTERYKEDYMKSRY